MKKKQIISLAKAVVIVLVLLGASGFGYVHVTGKKAGLEKKLNQLKGQASSNTSEKKNIERDIAKFSKAKEFFTQFSSDDSSDQSSFRRDKLREILINLKDELQLNSLSYNMEPFEEIGGDFKTENAVLTKSSVDIQFTALSDIMAFKLIKEIETRMPGDVLIENFVISKAKTIDNEILEKISDGEFADLVDGKISLKWRAIKLIDKEVENGQENNVQNL